MPYMPSGMHKKVRDKTGTHFKFGAGLGSALPRVTINNQYLFGHTDNLILL